MAAASPHISLAAENIQLFGITTSNALLTTWIVMAVLFILAFLATRQLKKKPGRGQMITELLIGGLFKFFENLGGTHGKKYAPLAVTMFLFIVLSNWFGLLPGVGTIGFFEEGKAHATKFVSRVLASPAAVVETAVVKEESHEEAGAAGTVKEETTSQSHEGEKAEEGHKKFVPLFRGPTADLNLTIALALIAVGAVQFFGFSIAGPSYIRKFIDIKSPINFFVGLLEIISDVSKIASFAFRLFGNVFAGEVLLTVMAFLPYALIGVPPLFLPIPFYLLEIFVGLIQGLVFAMLTTVFINVAVSHGEHLAHEKKHAKAHA
jgi:F-type H+-transporting ATPase subunit a